MIIAFCGHSKYISDSESEKKVLEILENRVGNVPSEFFLGEYGEFDRFAYCCAKKYKENHSNAKLVFVTPYMSIEYQKNHIEYKKDLFDLIIYPELEKIPPRYAILHRNRWVAEQADIIIANVSHKYGGAYLMFCHAKRKNREIFNLSQCNID